MSQSLLVSTGNKEITDCMCVYVCEIILRIWLRLLKTDRNRRDVQGGDKGRVSTKGYRHCGFSATEKNLIVICSGWQFGIWLVELISAVFNSYCKLLG